MKFAATLSLLFATAFYGCISSKSTITDSQHSSSKGAAFRVLTYNVLTGFQKNPKQADRFVDWVKTRNVDIVALQELSTFTQDSLERLALRYGHNYAVLNKGNGSPVGITSKYPLTNIERISDSMHHGCIRAAAAGFHFFVTHLSPFSYDKCVKEINGILAIAAPIPSKEKILIMGDLNSFSPADSSSYVQKRRYGVVQSLLDSGYTDSYWKIHRKFENSFPTTAYAKKLKAGTRIDYVFANENAARYIIDAEILKDSVTSNLSDHYPLLVTFKQ